MFGENYNYFKFARNYEYHQRMFINAYQACGNEIIKSFQRLGMNGNNAGILESLYSYKRHRFPTTIESPSLQLYSKDCPCYAHVRSKHFSAGHVFVKINLKFINDN